MSKRTVHRIGLISDTHKLLRPEAVDYLRGSDLIVHAGDLVTRDALETLRALAPVVAVRGNNDRGEWAAALHQTERVTIAGASPAAARRGADESADTPRGAGPA